jgi:hypothetical protein
MLPLLTALLFSGFVGFWLASLAVARSRRSLLTAWALAPSTFFLVKAVAEGGSDMVLPSLPWALMILIGWGGSALLGYYASRPRRRSFRNG